MRRLFMSTIALISISGCVEDVKGQDTYRGQDDITLLICNLEGLCQDGSKHKFPEPVQVVKYVEDTYPSIPFKDNFDTVMEFIFKVEGGYNPRDGGRRCPVNFGINQCFNKDIKVKYLTKSRAKTIYKKRYWNAINADDLSPALQLLAMDAAVNQGVNFTRFALKKSKGNLNKFYKIRKHRYYKLSKNGRKRYLRPWLNRLKEAKQLAMNL